MPQAEEYAEPYIAATPSLEGLTASLPPLAKAAHAMPTAPVVQPVSMISIRLSGTNIQIALGVRDLNAFPPEQSPDFVENFTLHIVDAMLCVRDPETHLKLALSPKDRISTLGAGEVKILSGRLAASRMSAITWSR